MTILTREWTREEELQHEVLGREQLWKKSGIALRAVVFECGKELLPVDPAAENGRAKIGEQLAAGSLPFGFIGEHIQNGSRLAKTALSAESRVWQSPELDAISTAHERLDALARHILKLGTISSLS